ncbi:MAG: NADH-quinone oxidoreductase subunit C [Actinomycetota bacterium]|nr:NADH-quinone oxidoreductase subunit C [Actinomycetota bacterium]
MTPEELKEMFDREFVEHGSAELGWGQVTVDLDAEGYVEAAMFCRDDPRLACDFFDCLAGVDEREDGFSVVAVLYSTTTRHRVMLRHRCGGGRDRPVAPTLTHVYAGADWHEREAWDMFGIEFDGHAGLLPRILTTENFEGWPLRKDFFLATREAKPWPGIKEPLEVDAEGRPIERERSAEPGAAPGPSALDEAMSEQARRAAGLLDESRVELAGGDDIAPRAPHTTAAGGGATEAHPDEEAAARAERARRKAAERRREKAAARDAAATADRDATVEPPPAPEDVATVATAQDPRVTSPEDRAEGAGPGAVEAARTPSRYDPGEESRTERARRAEEESKADLDHREPGQGGPPGTPPDPELPQAQGTTPTRAGGRGHAEGGGPGSSSARGEQPQPGAEAGEPPTVQRPGEAPVDGGIREVADRAADADGLEGGARPASTTTPPVPAPDEVDDEPTVTDLAGDLHGQASHGPSGPEGVAEVDQPGATGPDVATPPQDEATRSLPGSGSDALSGDTPDTMDPRERAFRDPATTGGNDLDAASSLPEAASRAETPEQSPATETDEEDQ